MNLPIDTYIPYLYIGEVPTNRIRELNIFDLIGLGFNNMQYHNMGPLHQRREVGRCAFGIIFGEGKSPR